MFKNKENNKSINYIMDTFTGADGGLAFINFLAAMEEVEKQDTPHGFKVLQIMKDFSNLIAILQKHPLPKENK